MFAIDCVWDPAKAEANLRKHGIDFAEAVSALEDERAKALRGLLMKDEYDFSNAKRGAVLSSPKSKTRITIRLDEDILAWFKEQVQKSGGGNYQSLINAALREYIANAAEPLEDTLRRVLREELKNAS